VHPDHAAAGGPGRRREDVQEHNYIGITEDANTMFAKVLSISDADVDWYTLLSFRSLAEIAALKAEVAGGRNPKDAKVLLAEITTRFHSAPPRPPSRISPTAARAACPTRSRGALAGAPLGIGLVLKQAGWRRPPARPTA
jgi:tyrosyl-tRNA synthetase